MSLHYAKVTEDTLYQKWKKTEKLDLFKPMTPPPGKKTDMTTSFIMKKSVPDWMQ